MRNYGKIAAPLTQLLWKDAFVWNQEAKEVMDKLKAAMQQFPIVSLVDFAEDFVVKTDASRVGVGNVLS